MLFCCFRSSGKHSVEAHCLCTTLFTSQESIFVTHTAFVTRNKEARSCRWLMLQTFHISWQGFRVTPKNNFRVVDWSRLQTQSLSYFFHFLWHSFCHTSLLESCGRRQRHESKPILPLYCSGKHGTGSYNNNSNIIIIIIIKRKRKKKDIYRAPSQESPERLQYK